MFSVKITVLIDHLRLHPESKFQAETMDSLCKCRKAAFNFVFIYYPIAKCTEIIVSLAKPAIIQNKHIKADIFCLFCDMI